jgi:EAL domain-containing protein (putative c-di-GMP-specific phosphodiesterase class I)
MRGRKSRQDWNEARALEFAMSLGEMEVWFQPQVGCDERLKGFEALVRWNHPLRGLIRPDEFIPDAERTGLIHTLGNRIMAQACRDCRDWETSGAEDLSVAVNASAVQFEQPDFADQVIATVSAAGLDPSRLIVELTETALLTDLDGTAEHLRRLRAAGVHTALDDFGSGYATLTCLATLPIEAIKLDHRFVRRTIDHKPAMLGSVIAMAHQIGYLVIGEGAETSADVSFLRNAGCDRIQGFYYGRPVPACTAARLCGKLPMTATD